MILEKYPEFTHIFNKAIFDVNRKLDSEFIKFFSTNKITETSTTKISKYVDGKFEEQELQCIETNYLVHDKDIEKMDLFFTRNMIFIQATNALRIKSQKLFDEFERAGWVYDPQKMNFVDWLILLLNKFRENGSDIQELRFNSNLLKRISLACKNKEELKKLKQWYLDNIGND